MTINYRYAVSFLLLLSGILLSSLVPGGPIENRDFSHIDPTTLLIFNIFLTVLGLGSFVLIRYVWKGIAWVWWLAFLAGLSYLIVYAADLATLFPKSPTPMSSALFWIEVTGLVIAMPMMWLSVRALQGNAGVSTSGVVAKEASALKFAVLAVAGVAVVVFATWSAMHPGG